MKKIHILLFVMILSFSCVDKNKTYKVFDDGKVIGDSSVVMFENGSMMKGLVVNDQKVGLWQLYDSLGVKKKYFEYKLINSKRFLNRAWDLDKNGDTIGGVFYEHRFWSDTLNYRGIQKLSIFLKYPLFSVDSEVFFLLPKKMIDLESDFSNYEEIEYDTIRSYDYNYKDGNKNSNRYIFLPFRTNGVGVNRIMGVLVEKFDEKIPDAKFSIREYFFDHSFYVRDTIK